MSSFFFLASTSNSGSQAMTGTELNLITQEIKTLGPVHWWKIHLRYETIAAKHAKSRKYSDANEWLRKHNELTHCEL